ncbi:MAG: adenosylmethionine decarboxylase [Candidatus Methanomethyliaceae archaeon]
MRELGRHFVFELFGCDPQGLDDLKGIQDAMERGAEDAGMRVLGRVFHKFSPQGVTGVVIIAESHIAIHTWPELGYAAVDVFTCSTNTDPMKAFERLKGVLKPKSMTVMELKRGLFMGDKV